MTVYFNGSRGQEATFDDPGYDDEIEFMKIEVEGNRLDIDLEDHLIDTFGEDWELELNEIRFERGYDDY